MIVRLAFALAWTREPAHRWRRVSVSIAAAVATTMLLAAVSLVALDRREEARAADRVGTLAATEHSTDLLWLERADEWNGRQFPVVWIESATRDQPVRPAGVMRMPRAGQAVLSPALHAVALREPEIAQRYPRHLVIGAAGVRGPGELLAYARPRPGRSIAHHRSTVRVARFGSPHGQQAVTISIDDSPALQALATGVAAFLAIPALLVAVAGAATGSAARDRRFALLHALGARRATVGALGAAETAILALPAASVAAFAWWTVAGSMRTVPVIGHPVFAGDLAVPGLSALLAPALVGAAMAYTGLASPARSRGIANRPRDERTRASAARIVPVGLALGIAMGGAAIGGRTGGTTMLAGMLLALAALPLVAAALMPALGALLAGRRPVPALLAGRRLQWDPVRSARPFGLVGTMLLLATLAGCYVALLGATDGGPVRRDVESAVTLRWGDARPGDLRELTRELPSAATIPMAQTRDGVALAWPCARLIRALEGGGCEAARLRVLLALPADTAVAVGARIRRPAAAAVVIGRVPQPVLDRRVRTAAQRTLVAASAMSPYPPAAQPTVAEGWLRAGLATALGALTLAVLLLAVDGALRARRSNAVLGDVGVARRDLRRIEVALFVLPLWTVAAAAGATGLLFAGLFVRTTGASPPIEWAAGVAVALVAWTVCGAVAVAGLATTPRGSPTARRRS